MNRIECNEIESPVNSKELIDYERSIIFIYGEVDENMALQISYGIKDLEDKKQDIKIHINSPGGFLDPCLSIITDLYNCNNNITTDIKGIAYSAASYIFLCGNKRLMSNFGSLMIHQPYFMIEDKIKNVENYTKCTKEIFERMLKTLLKNTKLSMTEYKKMYEKEDWFINPAQAKKLGLVHEIY